jgi:1-acyl-sn-glycerol-3-phosphate acyltransferase
MLARVLLAPLLRGWFGLRATGREHVPAQGAVIIACNHKSFLDPFFIGIALRRDLRFMAKQELFGGPLGWLLSRLGAFPVRRGAADAVAMRTARAILAQGGALVMFPEGTRVGDPAALGLPHHGAGRLALETAAPLVPAAIAGTDHLWLGPLPRPRRVQLAFGRAIDPRPLAGRPDALTQLVDGELWPAVREEYTHERTRPGLLLAGLAALGLGGGLLARRQAHARPRILGVVEPLKVRRRRARRERLERLRLRRR